MMTINHIDSDIVRKLSSNVECNIYLHKPTPGASLEEFYRSHHALVDKYSVAVSQLSRVIFKCKLFSFSIPDVTVG